MDVPKTSRRLLTDFLDAHAPSESNARSSFRMSPWRWKSRCSWPRFRLPSRLTEAGQTQQTAYEIGCPRDSGSADEPDADNRRTQTRYACRLGAEVYRTGISVPNHCCLTDLSSGGCYLEVSLPFPQGVLGRDRRANPRNEIAIAGNSSGFSSRLRDGRGV